MELYDEIFIEHLTILVNGLALLTIALLSKGRSAFLVMIPLVVLLDAFHQKVHTVYLDWAYDKECTINLLGNSIDCTLFVYHAWYLTFSFTDLLLIVLCVLVCKTFKLATDRFSNIVLLDLFARAFVNFARWLDRNIIESDYLEVFYGFAIPTINIGISVILIMAVITAFKNKFVLKY